LDRERFQHYCEELLEWRVKPRLALADKSYRKINPKAMRYRIEECASYQLLARLPVEHCGHCGRITERHSQLIVFNEGRIDRIRCMKNSL